MYAGKIVYFSLSFNDKKYFPYLFYWSTCAYKSIHPSNITMFLFAFIHATFWCIVFLSGIYISAFSVHCFWKFDSACLESFFFPSIDFFSSIISFFFIHIDGRNWFEGRLFFFVSIQHWLKLYLDHL